MGSADGWWSPVVVATWAPPLAVFVFGAILTWLANKRNKLGPQQSAEQDSHDTVMTGASDYIVHLERNAAEGHDREDALQARINQLERQLGRAEGRAKRRKKVP